MDIAQLAIIIGLILNIAAVGFGFGIFSERVKNLVDKYEEQTQESKKLIETVNGLCIRVSLLEKEAYRERKRIEEKV